MNPSYITPVIFIFLFINYTTSFAASISDIFVALSPQAGLMPCGANDTSDSMIL